MEGSSVISSAKRPLDPSAVRSESNGSNTTTPTTPGKRRTSGKPNAETLFRILCPSEKTGGVIGKGGATIRQLREETGAKIRIDDPVLGSDERVILVVGSSDPMADADPAAPPSSQAQQALVRVFERMMKAEEEKEKEKEGEGHVACRLLAAGNQVGCVLGKGGKIVEKMRSESGAQIRILSKDQIPMCAGTGDELIQITGSFSSVRKALLSVSSCLQDNPRSDANNFVAAKPLGPTHRGTGPPSLLDPFPQRGHVNGSSSLDYHSRGHSMIQVPENVSAGQRKFLEEEIVFRLLCSNDRVGSLIGKGGAIVRGLQNETGTSIKVQEAMPDSEERVVVISAVENSELKRSPAQDAVIRVHSRITEAGTEKVSTVSARLLVPAQQIGCLLGKGGNIIAEMRRASGASIKIFVNEHVPKCASLNDEVVQVTGNLQSVQDALFHITSRLREIILPTRPHSSVVTGTAPEIPPVMFRQRHEPISPSPGHYSSSVGLSHGLDRSASFPRTIDQQPVPSQSMDRLGLVNADLVSHPYRGEVTRHVHAFDRPSSPRSRPPQAVSSVYPVVADIGAGLVLRGGAIGSASEATVVTDTATEVIVPQQLLGFIYGENGSNLSQIRQISGAKVIINDPSHGATEGMVIISGTPDQTRAAQSLLQAFILCGQTTP
ncbi:hypothetical protein AAC387_Pa03g0042 [Persea americana]